MILAGCAAGSANPQPDLSDRNTLPGSEIHVEAELDDLPDVLRATFRELYWSQVRLDASDQRIQTAALLPDGRTVRISIREDPETSDRLLVRAQVGYFGAPMIERQFLDALQDELAGR